jgi:hypothetical protein
MSCDALHGLLSGIMSRMTESKAPYFERDELRRRLHSQSTELLRLQSDGLLDRLPALSWCPRMVLPNKKDVLEALVQHLSELAEQAMAAAKTTSVGATHAEAKPEHAKDTRALEQSYLARGQAMRAEELSAQVKALRFMPLRDYGESDLTGVGALVAITSDEDMRCLFLAPHGGGTEVDIGGKKVVVVIPQSALGSSVLGRALNDTIELRVRGVTREYVISAIA